MPRTCRFHPLTTRIRVTDSTHAFLTLKGPSTGATRVECEYPLALDIALKLLKIAKTPVLTKTRYCILFDSKVFEIDAYHGTSRVGAASLEGLFSVEVELVQATESVTV